jgi:hypothetical protein
MHAENVSSHRTERDIAGTLFFPVHLNNEELLNFTFEFLQNFNTFPYGQLKVFVRTDKGGKGIDFKFAQTEKTPNQILKVRQISFGLNANWKLVDYFEHYITGVGATKKVVAGKEYFYPKYVACESIGMKTKKVDNIYEQRLKNPQPPARNPLFEHDNWTLILEHNNWLPSTKSNCL